MSEDERTACILALCFLFLFLQRGALVRPLLLLARMMLVCGVIAAVTMALLL